MTGKELADKYDKFFKDELTKERGRWHDAATAQRAWDRLAERINEQLCPCAQGTGQPCRYFVSDEHDGPKDAEVKPTNPRDTALSEGIEALRDMQVSYDRGIATHHAKCALRHGGSSCTC